MVWELKMTTFKFEDSRGYNVFICPKQYIWNQLSPHVVHFCLETWNHPKRLPVWYKSLHYPRFECIPISRSSQSHLTHANYSVHSFFYWCDPSVFSPLCFVTFFTSFLLYVWIKTGWFLLLREVFFRGSVVYKIYFPISIKNPHCQTLIWAVYSICRKRRDRCRRTGTLCFPDFVNFVLLTNNCWTGPLKRKSSCF